MSARFESLREGRSAGQGEFVLDQEQARRKLQEFQLVDPRRFLLEFVRAAHLLRATQIEFRIDADEVAVHFDGDHLTEEELGGLYSAPFSQRTNPRQRALRHLAIGVNAAQGLGLRDLLIGVGGAQPHGLSFQIDGEEKLKPEHAPAQGTRIYLRESLRVRHVMGLFGRTRQTRHDEALFDAHCQFARIPITVNGRRINPVPFSATEPRIAIELDGPHETGFVYFDLKALRRDRGQRFMMTHLYHNGVLVGAERRHAPISAQAFVDSSRLTLNLSQSAFVEDAAWTAIYQELCNAAGLSLARHLQELAAEELEAQRPELLRQLFPFDELASTLGSDPTRALVEAVEPLPLLATATPPGDGTLVHVPVTEARKICPTSGRTSITFARRSAEAGTKIPGHLTVVALPTLVTRTPQECLSHFADEVRDLSDVLDQAARISENRRWWELGSRDIEPNQYPHFTHVREEEIEGLRVTVGLRFTSASAVAGVSEIVYIKDGRSLGIRTVAKSQVSGLAVTIRGDFEPNALFDAPAPSPRMKRTWGRVLAMIAQIVEHFSPDRKIAYIKALIEGDINRKWAEAVGPGLWPLEPEQETFRRIKAVKGDGLTASRQRMALLDEHFGSATPQGMPKPSITTWNVFPSRLLSLDDLWRELEKNPDKLVNNFISGAEMLRDIFPSRTMGLSEYWELTRAARAEQEQKQESPPRDMEETSSIPSPAQSESREDALVRLLRTELDEMCKRTWIQGAAPWVKRVAPIDDIRFVDQCDARAVTVHQDGIELHEDHPAVRDALEHPSDPVARAFLTYTIFSASSRLSRGRLDATAETGLLNVLNEALDTH